MNRIRIKGARFYTHLSYLHHIGKTPLKYTTLGKQLELTSSRFPEREAVIAFQENRRITYHDLLSQADRFAAGLHQIGVNYGDRVGIWAPNILEWNILCFACARAGFVAVFINPNYIAQELEYCINKVGMKVIICPEMCDKLHFYDTLGTIVSNLRQQKPENLNNPSTQSLKNIITVSENSLGGTFNYNEILHLANETSIKKIKSNQDCVRPDDAVNIQFTSGTTGKPKAAMVSHYNLVNNAFFIGQRNELETKHHKICVQVPFFHAFGCTITIGAAISHGATMVVPSPRYNPLQNLKAIKEENCTIIHGTPTMYVDLVNVQSQYNENISPEIAVSGGALCSPELFKKMKKHLNVNKVKSVYGLTETTACVFQTMPSDDEEKMLNTVGHVCDHLEVKLVDENNKVVPLGTPGELCVRGYTTMLGYWEDREKTDEMIDNHHWLKTG
uniref:Medium-chain acyl-CoA ligase ACSF2, mitochondrial n=2 Tax=Photinus pyralis TaxID=7054 RepID=A0A1Y1L8H9_PHOPY